MAALRRELAAQRTLIDERFNGYIAAFHSAADLRYHNDDVELEQRCHLAVLQPFAALCKAEGIEWFMFAGTLLGGMRHRGFIPWDDDLDLAMERPAYERLRAALIRRGPSAGQLQELIRRDGVHFARYRLADPRRILHIDIFLFDGCRLSDPLRARLHLRRNTVQLRRRLAAVFARHQFRGQLAEHPGPAPEALWQELQSELQDFRRCCGWTGDPQAPLAASFTFGEIVVPRAVIQPLGSLEFEGLQLPAPHDPAALLRAQYGDWQQLPADVGRPPHSGFTPLYALMLEDFLKHHPYPPLPSKCPPR